MDSPSTSRLSFRDARGRRIDAPLEWSEATVEVDTPPETWESVRLWRQGEPLAVYLTRLAGRIAVCADWPRSGAGHYSLRLDCAGNREERLLTVLPEKLSLNAYARLLEDLETRLPVAIAVGLQRGGALAGVKLPPPSESSVAQELSRLRRAVHGTERRPGLSDILITLARDHHRVLTTHREWVRRERARRTDATRLAAALYRPGNIGSDRRPERIVDMRVEHTVDVYENRLVLAFAHEVDLRLRRLLRLDAIGRLVKAHQEAQDLLDKLQSARRTANFLDEVSLPAYAPTRLSMVLLYHPAYRAALDGYLELHRSLSVHLDEPALEAPLENLPVLYQIWGTLQVIAALLEIAGDAGYRVDTERLTRRSGNQLYVRVLPGGQPAVVLRHPERGTCVRLIPECAYGDHGELQSVSHEQRPDVSIEVRARNAPPRLYLFDPKYKLDSERVLAASQETESPVDAVPAQATRDACASVPERGALPGSRPAKMDIDKMHAYRDAIRDGEGRRVVTYAAILYPGQGIRYATGIEALPACPGDDALLRAWLSEVLSQALDPER